MAFPGASPSSSLEQQAIRTVLPGGITVWTFVARHASHLLVKGAESILIDCHDRRIADQIRELGLPQPELILHTHVQPWHCREGGLFPDARVRVHRGDEMLAFDPEAVCRTVTAQRADLLGWSVHFGKEPFGIAGCQTEFPPEVPLLSAGMTGGCFEGGDFFRCGDVELKVIDLAFHGKHAVGFQIIDAEGQTRGIFIGDLFRKGPFLVDASSLVASYVESRFSRLPALLDQLAAHGNVPLFPANGLPITRGAYEISILKARIGDALGATRNGPPLLPRQEPVGIGKPGRLRKIADGIYNLANAGNTIALIDPEGNAIMVDPGPCDYENEHRDRDFIEDLVTLETVAGLKRVDFVLITHFHGDHIDMVHQVRERYPNCKVATWAAVAEVMELPERFNYSARLPWYGLEVKTVPVDLPLAMGATLDWRGCPIRVIHLPGHALVHCGFLLTFRGENLAITGDSVQGNGEIASLETAITNHSVPNEAEGVLGSYRTLARQKVDLNLGGHGNWFRDCQRVYEQSILRIAAQQAAMERLFMPGALREAYVPSWMSQMPDAVSQLRLPE